MSFCFCDKIPQGQNHVSLPGVTLLVTSLPTPGTCAEHDTLRLLCLPLKSADIAKIPLHHEDTLSDYNHVSLPCVTLLVTSLPTPGTCAEHGTLRLLCLPLKTTDIAKIPLQHEDTLSDYGPIFCTLSPFRLPRPLHRLLARRSLSIHDIALESYSTALLPSPTTLLVAENLLQVSQIAI